MLCMYVGGAITLLDILGGRKVGNDARLAGGSGLGSTSGLELGSGPARDETAAESGRSL